MLQREGKDTITVGKKRNSLISNLEIGGCLAYPESGSW
jgi:hypothetical protein